MGADPKTSVHNIDGQSHEIPNLFVGDSSVFSALPRKKSTLTNIALAWRMSRRRPKQKEENFHEPALCNPKT